MQPHGEQSEDSAGSAVQPAGGMQHGEQEAHLTGGASAHADGTEARRVGTRRRTGSMRVARPAAHPDHSGSGADSSRGWTLVMVAVASFAIGVFVGGYARRSSEKREPKRKAQTYFLTGVADPGQQRQDRRKAIVHMRGPRDHV